MDIPDDIFNLPNNDFNSKIFMEKANIETNLCQLYIQLVNDFNILINKVWNEKTYFIYETKKSLKNLHSIITTLEDNHEEDINKLKYIFENQLKFLINTNSKLNQIDVDNYKNKMTEKINEISLTNINKKQNLLLPELEICIMRIEELFLKLESKIINIINSNPISKDCNQGEQNNDLENNLYELIQKENSNQGKQNNDLDNNIYELIQKENSKEILNGPNFQNSNELNILKHLPNIQLDNIIGIY